MWCRLDLASWNRGKGFGLSLRPPWGLACRSCWQSSAFLPSRRIRQSRWPLPVFAQEGLRIWWIWQSLQNLWDAVEDGHRFASWRYIYRRSAPALTSTWLLHRRSKMFFWPVQFFLSFSNRWLNSVLQKSRQVRGSFFWRNLPRDDSKSIVGDWWVAFEAAVLHASTPTWNAVEEKGHERDPCKPKDLWKTLSLKLPSTTPFSPPVLGSCFCHF